MAAKTQCDRIDECNGVTYHTDDRQYEMRTATRLMTHKNNRSWLKYHRSSAGILWSVSFNGRQLSDNIDGHKYQSLDTAKLRCQTNHNCRGVTYHNGKYELRKGSLNKTNRYDKTWLMYRTSVQWSGAHKYKKLDGYSNGQRQVYPSLAISKIYCELNYDCYGITQYRGKYELRRGRALKFARFGISWVKSYKHRTGISWSGEHRGKTISGYSNGYNQRYDYLDQAKKLCELNSDCNGITKFRNHYELRSSTVLQNASKGESSWLIRRPSASWGPERKGYLEGIIDSQIYGSLAAAKAGCKIDVDCKGITKRDDKYELRKGTVLKTSSSGESSWLKQK